MAYCNSKNIEIAREKGEMVVPALMSFLFTSHIVVEGSLSNF